MCPSGMLRVGRQRVQFLRASERDEQWGVGGMLPSSSVVRSGMVSDGAAARRAWGVAVVQIGGVCVCVGPTILVGTAPLSPLGAAQTPRHLQRHRKRASAGGSADCIRA